jgi:hypothetical protein
MINTTQSDVILNYYLYYKLKLIEIDIDSNLILINKTQYIKYLIKKKKQIT